MLSGMEGSVLGVWSAHGEGRLQCDPELSAQILSQGLAPVRYVSDYGLETESYPANPNGSPFGIAALCTPDGRHLAMMPHPERAFQDRQWPWMPDEMKNASGLSPWIQMFINAWRWCEETSGNK
jgi:phosphoribosylformylglycinamidine synthase